MRPGGVAGAGRAVGPGGAGDVREGGVRPSADALREGRMAQGREGGEVGGRLDGGGAQRSLELPDAERERLRALGYLD